MSGQVSRGSAGEYQSDERAGGARLSWRVSGKSLPLFVINRKLGNASGNLPGDQLLKILS